jgi:hypothetical protein
MGLILGTGELCATVWGVVTFKDNDAKGRELQRQLQEVYASLLEVRSKLWKRGVESPLNQRTRM